MFEFFPQAMLPAVDLEGKIMMHSPSEIKLAPNGNGGFFDSIVKIDSVRTHLESLEYVQVIGVDNIMNKVLDPVHIGFTACNNFTVSLKTCPKAYPGEKVGVVAKKDGKYAIVEYSELTEEHTNAKMDDGKTLKFRHGSILMFMFNARALMQIAQSKEASQLYHKAFKKVDYYSMSRECLVKAEKETGWKFELFI